MDALTAALAALPEDERALLETIHRLRNELATAELELANLRRARAATRSGEHGA